MNSDRPLIWGAAAAVIVLAGALFWYSHRTPPAVAVTASVPVAPVPSEPAPPTSPPAQSAPAIEHPVPEGSGPEPMPSAVDHSDDAVLNIVSGLPNGSAIVVQLVPQNVIRHVVAAVDNLSKRKLAVNLRPFRDTPEQFKVSDAGGQLTVSPDNYARYKPFVDMVRGTDMTRVADIYFHFYPLFQSAFDDLGYQDGYFNDRVIALIDLLLATPDQASPPQLVQPNVMYLYADPALESLSAGQKTLLRMGPDNAGVIKGKLRELKSALLAHERH